MTEYIKKCIYLSIIMLPFTLTSSMVSAQELKWGLSLGVTQVDNEYLNETEEGETITRDVDWLSTQLAIDVSTGPHSLSLSTATADDETPSFAGTYYNDLDPSVFSQSSLSMDLDDLSINYTYRLNANWTIGLGFNQIEHAFSESRLRSYSNPTDLWDNDNSYDLSYIDNEALNVDGTTLLLGYNNQIAEKWFFTAKLGYIQQELDFSGQQTWTFTGFSETLNNCLKGGTSPCEYTYTPPIPANSGIEGDGYINDYVTTGDADSVVLGIGFVWLLNPKNQIYFDYTLRGGEYDSLTYTPNDRAKPGGYLAIDDSEAFRQPTVSNDSIENDYYFLSVRWRYSLN